MTFHHQISQPAGLILQVRTPVLVPGDQDQATGVVIPMIRIVPKEPWAHYETAPLPISQTYSPSVVACQVGVAGKTQPDSNMGYYATGRTYAGQSVTTMARVVTPLTGLLTKADFSGTPGGSLTLRVYDLTDGSLIYTEAVVVADAVEDVPSATPEWTADSVGYNFRHKLDHNKYALEGAGKKYRLEYELINEAQTGTGEPVYVVSEITIDGLLSR